MDIHLRKFSKLLILLAILPSLIMILNKNNMTEEERIFAGRLFDTRTKELARH